MNEWVDYAAGGTDVRDPKDDWENYLPAPGTVDKKKRFNSIDSDQNDYLPNATSGEDNGSGVINAFGGMRMDASKLPMSENIEDRRKETSPAEARMAEKDEEFAPILEEYRSILMDANLDPKESMKKANDFIDAYYERRDKDHRTFMQKMKDGFENIKTSIKDRAAQAEEDFAPNRASSRMAREAGYEEIAKYGKDDVREELRGKGKELGTIEQMSRAMSDDELNRIMGRKKELDVPGGVGGSGGNVTIMRNPANSNKNLQIETDPKVQAKIDAEWGAMVKKGNQPDLKSIEGTIPKLEKVMGDYAQGKATAKDVQKVFKENGWSVNLRGKSGEAEAFDPSGTQHWLNF